MYISYGSADMEARVLQLPLAELERAFTGKVAFRKVAVPYRPANYPAKTHAQPRLT